MTDARRPPFPTVREISDSRDDRPRGSVGWEGADLRVASVGAADAGAVAAACAAVLTRYVNVPGAVVAMHVLDPDGSSRSRAWEIGPDANVGDIVGSTSDRPSTASGASGGELVHRFSLVLDGRTRRAPGREGHGPWAVRLVTSAEGTTVYADATQVDPGSVRDFARHVETVLGAAESDPLLPLVELDLLGPGEKEFLLRRVNATGRVLPSHGTIFAEFAARVRRQPGRVLCVQGDRTYSYQRIHDMAEAAAASLLDHGVRRGAGVAIRMDRSPLALAVILAILRVGAYYVPIGKHLPRAEAMRVVDVARPELVLGDEPVDLGDARVLVVDEALFSPGGTDEAMSGGSVACAPSPDDLCYILFSSGSTGVPKGIRLRHGGVLNNLLDLRSRYEIGPGDAVLSVSNLSFDMSVFELLGSAISGATVVFPDADLAHSPRHWRELLLEHSVSIWNSAPALLMLLLAEPRAAAALSRLRLALCGGDWMPASLPERLWRLAPECRVVNLGGATEASIHSTSHEVTTADLAGGTIPYGAPLANQRIYVLDPAERPVPVGVPGELLIAGTGVGAGYVGVDGSAAGRFRPWSYADVAEGRAYRTGDIVRMTVDGELELLGRSDFQVKVNGVRLDTRDIEERIRALPRVTDCVVFSSSANGRTQLQAVLVTDDGDSLDLRGALHDVVPAWAMPSAHAVVRSLPRSSNGKLDRRAAAALVVGADEGEDPELSGAQGLVAGAWRTALSLEGRALRPDDDFFALGGDSFAAMRVVQLLDQRIDLGDVFAASSLMELAERLEGATR